MKKVTEISPEDVFMLLCSSSKRVRNWEGRTEPSIELAERLLNKLQDTQAALEPLLESEDNLRFVALDFSKKCLTKKFGKSWGFSSVSAVLKQFWRETVVGNLGVVCGQYQNRFLVVIDIDAKRDRQASVEVIANAVGVPTFMVNTPSGGKHLYFWSKSKVGCPKVFSKAGVDIKGEGGYVVAPGSITSKGCYSWDVENSLFSQEISELPGDWEQRLEGVLGLRDHIQLSLPSLVQERTENRAESTYTTVPSSLGSELVQKGSRNSYMTAKAGSLVHTSESPEALVAQLKDIRATDLEEPESFSDEEIEKIVAWVFKKESDKEQSASNYSVKEELSPLEQRFADSLRAAKDKVKQGESSVVEAGRIYQQFLESRGFVFSKSIKLQVVAKVLRAAGCKSTEKNVRIEGSKKRTKVRVWDVSSEALMLAFDLLEKGEKRMEDMVEKIKMKTRKQMVPSGCNVLDAGKAKVVVDMLKVQDNGLKAREEQRAKMNKNKPSKISNKLYAMVACFILILGACAPGVGMMQDGGIQDGREPSGFSTDEREVVGPGAMIARPLSDSAKILLEDPLLVRDLQSFGSRCVSSRIVWDAPGLPTGCFHSFDGTNSRVITGNTLELNVKLVMGCRSSSNTYHPFTPGQVYSFSVLSGVRVCGPQSPLNSQFARSFNGLLRVENP